jgi:putative ABC transport system substrate-binding protein
VQKRDFILALIAATIGPSTQLRAQQGRTPSLLGYIWIGAKGSERSTLDGLRAGLRDLSYVEERDYAIADRYAGLDRTRLPELVAEIARLKVSLFLAPGNDVIEAVIRATNTIPIIATAPDLLASGFVASLPRPGGNVTGISLTAGEALSEKWLELVKEVAPEVSHVAVLSNPSSAASTAFVQRIRDAASKFAIRRSLFEARDENELNRALRSVEASEARAIIVDMDPSLVSNRATIIKFAAERRLPAVYGNYEYVPDGGLISYATSIFDTWRRLAFYVDKVLKGTSPAELPVEQASNFLLRINMGTARALGLTIPPTLLARADEVIE